MIKLNVDTVSSSDMFGAMLESIGVIPSSVSDELHTNLLDEVELFASEKNFHYDADKDVYRANDSVVGSWVR